MTNRKTLHQVAHAIWNGCALPKDYENLCRVVKIILKEERYNHICESHSEKIAQMIQELRCKIDIRTHGYSFGSYGMVPDSARKGNQLKCLDDPLVIRKSLRMLPKYVWFGILQTRREEKKSGAQVGDARAVGWVEDENDTL